MFKQQPQKNLNTKHLVFIASIVVACSIIFPGCASKHRKTGSQIGSYKIDGMPYLRDIPANVSKVPNAVPKLEPKSRYGNPIKYTVLNKTYHVMSSGAGYKARGKASWYGKKFHGYRTSSGEPYNMFAMTAAHKTLPLPTYLLVKNLENGKQVIVKVNDRGPFHKDRIIDLSYAAAVKLEILKSGTVYVEITALDPEKYHRNKSKVNLTVVASNEIANQQNPYNNENSVKITNSSQPQTAEQQIIRYLQLGAFKQQQNAEKRSQQVQSLIIDNNAEVKVISTKDQAYPIFKVLVGPFNSLIESDKAKQQLLAANLPAPILVLCK